jgi:hypothetical protein
MDTTNPRATIGDNLPDPIDYAKDETGRLQADYAETARMVDSLLDEFEEMPEVIEETSQKGSVASLIKRMRDTAKRIDGLRELEKTPHFRRGQGCDQFFNGLLDRLSRREKKNRPGAADILQQRLTDYDTKLLLAEQERRRKEAAEAARIARARAEAEAKAAREAEETRLAAERARLVETKAAKQAAATMAQEAASAAAIEAAVAADQAEAAYIETLARPADIMRTRGADGTLTTMARENYAEIEDATKLDMAVLWPFIALAAKERALALWARSTGHRQQMAGARIGDRPKSVVR